MYSSGLATKDENKYFFFASPSDSVHLSSSTSIFIQNSNGYSCQEVAYVAHLFIFYKIVTQVCIYMMGAGNGPPLDVLGFVTLQITRDEYPVVWGYPEVGTIHGVSGVCTRCMRRYGSMCEWFE